MSNSYTDKIKKNLESQICCLKAAISAIGINNKSIVTSEDYELVLQEGELLTHVVLETTAGAVNLKIGTTLGGDELYNDTISDGYEVISLDQYAYNGTSSLFFSGFDPSNVTLHFLIQKVKL